jgi:hypothetical protein
VGDVEARLRELLAGKGTRYDDPTVQMLQGQALSQRETAREQGLSALRGEALRRGVPIAQSGAAFGAAQQLIRQTGKDFGDRMQQIQIEKVTADYEDQVTALKLAQDHIEATRDWLIRSDLVGIERQKIQAQLTLGFANIGAQRAIADQQYALGLGGLALENKSLDMQALGYR